MKRWQRGLLAVVILVLAVPVTRWTSRSLDFYRDHVSTDNAYVGADIAQITARIPGTVAALEVKENWQVKAGQELVRFDRAEYEVKLRGAEAAYSSALEGVAQLRSAVRVAQSQVQLARAGLEQARLDDGRATRLARSEAVPAERVERGRSALRAAEASLAAAERQEELARAALGIDLEADSAGASAVRAAQAAREEAGLLLSYTSIPAPISGIVAKRSVELGQRVQPGQPMFWIVPIDDVYVDANFKETQLAGVRVGQPVEVVADLYPGRVYRGRVDSIAPGSGAAFALLPPENASGNWIKVVQRVPVRISLDEPVPVDYPLRVSLSVTATIDTRDGDGSLLAPLSQTRPGP